MRAQVDSIKAVTRPRHDFGTGAGNTSERVRCRRCTMTFRVEPPEAASERWRCPEPGCNRRFWTRVAPASRLVVVGVWPSFAEATEGGK